MKTMNWLISNDALKDAIVEALRDSDMTEGELQRYLRREMHPDIRDRDASRALGLLLKSGRVREIMSRDPFGALDGMPSLYVLTECA